MNAAAYEWNIEMNVGGVTFTGPGMESEAEAQGVATIVENSIQQSTGLNIEVVRQ